MNSKLLNKLVSIVSALSLLINSLGLPAIAYAQDATDSGTPEVIETPTETPTPTEEIVVPTPTEELAPAVENSSTEQPSQEQSQPTSTPEVSVIPTVTTTPVEEKGEITAVIVQNIKATSIEFTNVNYNSDGTATITTDKLDYAPTDVVVIAGKDFKANTEYDLEITGTGGFSFKDKVKSDESGALFYSYQLDGTYRPDYKVEVKSGGTVVAAVTFTDTFKVTICHATNSPTHPYNQIDVDRNSTVQGHDSHQDDIIPDFWYWSWSWSDWRWHQYPGKNWNTEGKAIYNNGCNIPVPKGTIQVNKDVVPNDATLWDFSIAGPSTNSVTLADGGQSSVLTSNIGPYTITETPDNAADTSRYTTAYSCTGAAAPITGSGMVASFTLGANQNMVCTFTNTLKPVTVTVNKIIDNDGNLATTGDRTSGSGWTLQAYKESPLNLMATDVTGPSGQATLPSFYPTAGATYKVIEQVQGGYIPMSSSCVKGAAAPIPVGQGGSSGQVTGISVNPGDTISCTFINKPITGSIKITKNSRPDDPQNFIFNVYTTGGPIGNAELDDYSGGGDSSPKSNNATFSNLVSGSYSIAEQGVAGWELTDISCTGGTNWNVTNNILNVTITSGENYECTFTNRKLGAIRGYKFNDKNGDNDRDSGEERLPGWNIVLKDMSGNELDSDITDPAGWYAFENLRPGDYQVCEIPGPALSEWIPSSGSLCQNATVTRGNDTYAYFGNHGPVKIKAYKIVCPLEADLPNWGSGTMASVGNTTADDFLAVKTGCYYQSEWNFQWGYGSRPGDAGVQKYGNGAQTGFAPVGAGYNQWKNFDTITNGSTPAEVTINNLRRASSLWVREVLPSVEWLPFTYPPALPSADNISAELYCHTDVLNYDNYDRIDSPEYGQTYYCVAFNTLNRGGISGNKWGDVDGEGDWDGSENGLAGWTITATGAGGQVSTTTDENGAYEFSNLLPGVYTVCELNQVSYVQTYPGGNGCHTVTVVGGQTQANNNFGNQLVDLGISVVKTNILISGNLVEYTLQITNTGNQDFPTFEVHDALPGGFTYESGSSWLGTLNVEPAIYSGELLWSFDTTLAKGETKTLKYRAMISSDLPAGKYTNFAYAKGHFDYRWCHLEKTDGAEPDGGIECDPASEIDDSVVELSPSLSYGGKLTPQVLGAATELPATGSGTSILVIILAAIVIGLGLKYGGKLPLMKGKKHGKR